MSTLREFLKDVSVEWKDLKEISNFSNGKGHEKVISEDGKYIVVNSKFVSTEGNVVKFSNEQISPVYKNDILIVMSDLPNGRALAKTYLVNEDSKYTLNQRIGRISIIDINMVYPKYLNYMLNRSSQLLRFDNGVDQTNLKKSDIENVQIPIPHPNDLEKSLAIQQEIVRVLDGLSEQNKALTTALAQEIDQRKKQYEFYREELFRFEGKAVEWKTLGDENVGKFTRGSGLQKKDFTEFGIGCIHYGQVYTYYNTYTYETKSFVSVDFAKNARKAKMGDLVIATTSENDDDVCKAVAWLGEEDIAVSSDACFYSHKLNPKYVSYYFQTEQFQKQKRKYITGTKVRRVNVNDLEKITIPNPDITEQERIVHLLDQFDEATKNIVAQLEKEIELRNKKYEYYRTLLLSFSN